VNQSEVGGAFEIGPAFSYRHVPHDIILTLLISQCAVGQAAQFLSRAGKDGKLVLETENPLYSIN
jgi:hypothetical protein